MARLRRELAAGKSPDPPVPAALPPLNFHMPREYVLQPFRPPLHLRIDYARS